MKMKKKFLIIIGVIVVIIVLVVVNLLQREKGKEVEVAIVSTGNIKSEVTASGILRAQSQVDISSETIARIERIHYSEGDNVKKGDLLIELNDVDARASMDLARAQREQAEQEYERAQKLYEKELISQESFEKYTLSYETARAQYDRAKDAYRKTRIYAPISGKIMKINVEEGETAVMGTMNYQGTVLMTIADMSQMIAVIRVDETDIPDVRLGQSAEVIADALPDSIFPGTVTKTGLMPIMSELTTDNVTDFEVEIELAEFSPLLRPGMNVKTDIITNNKEDVIVIPIQAAGKREIEEEDTTAETVFVVRGDKAHLTKIIMGVSSDTETEIIEGVAEGDTIIIGPYRVLSKLEDEEKVTFEVEEDSISQSSKPHRLFRRVRGAGRRRS
jgi:HlyD family secretion protein